MARSNGGEFFIVSSRQINPTPDNRNGDHDVHPKCRHCGVRYDDLDLVYVIHDTRCPYYNALKHQVGIYMRHNLHLRDQNTSQLCIG